MKGLFTLMWVKRARNYLRLEKELLDIIEIEKQKAFRRFGFRISPHSPLQ